MGIENDIQKLFSKVLEEYGGNKSAAAEALGVNNVTFLGAGSQENVVLTPSFAEPLIRPEEYFSFRGEKPCPSPQPCHPEQDMRALNQRIKELEKR